ncbi:FecCD family ABC transporter permease [Aliidiomarina celeris]|uniref:FecCD family ABC transporter permease n=1 Tax=Aliidiomarina celeris TaxID=2249428 RepID=UPI001E3618A7|nr:iron ABC transporter permease [Aliidiomarina celeris]
MVKSQRLLFFMLVLALVASAVLGLFAGPVDVPVWQVLFIGQQGVEPELQWARQILLDVRMPRVLLAILVGFSLALAGAAMQGLLRNPLAEPGIIGVSGGAAVVSVFLLYFGFALWQSWLLPLGAVFGSVLALAGVLLIAGKGAPVVTLILAGVAVAAFLSGVVALLLSMAPNPFALQELTFWLMGSVAYRDLNQLGYLLPFFLLGSVLVLRSGRFLQALTLGEEIASSLGFAVAVERLKLLFGVALLVGSSVAMTGIIGFVGLIVPHLMRHVGGADPRKLLLNSALAGALFVLWADIAVQLIPTTTELQVGVVLTLLGGPFFLWILLHHRARYLGFGSS